MKKLITITLFSGLTMANVYPVKNNLGLQASTQGKVLHTETNESGDITFYYENGYCVNFVNNNKLVCNLD